MYGYEIFHDELMENLIKSVRTFSSSHAYIFEGEKGLGKLNAARLFAAALTCQNVSSAPCGACHTCIESKADTNPDIVYIRTKKDKKTIGADDMRELEEDVAIKPFNSSHKVYIIENGAQLTEAAQNTFLKTFEEPPEYAVFIIVIENSELLLQTIRSRFTLVHFPSVSDEIVERYITTKYPQEQERLPFLVKYCAGIPGAADDVINDEAFDTLRTDALEKLFSLLSSDKRGAFIIQKFLEENKDRAGDIFNFWLSFMRDITLIHTQSSERIINIDKKEQLRQLAAKIDPKNIVDMSGKIVKASEMLSRYVNIKAISLWLALKHA